MVDTTLNNAHSLEGHQVLRAYEVDRSTGLSTTEVEARHLKFGRNQLKERPAVSFLELVRQQFEDLLVRILLGAAVVSFLLAYLEEHEEASWTNYVEPLVILLILFANACVGVWQESNAEQALEALKKLQPLHATVLRDGRVQVIDAEDLVPGDLAEVSVGDRVPADIRVLELKTVTLNANQSSLTGESEDVFKDSLPIQEDADLVAQNNMLFASTAIPKGSCWGVVVKTGMETQIGLIQAAVLEAEEEEEPTPLQLKIEEFGNQLAKVIFVVCILVWAINYQHFFDPIHGSVFRGCVYYFKIAVALAVAAIPEGLPAVITTSLALGTRRMAKRNAIVRKIKSVQTLGCTTVICTDKTGTLTTNQMTVVNFQLAGQNQLSVTSMEEDGSAPATLPDSRAFTDFVKIALTCNTSEANASGEAVAQGSPTEAALLHMAHGLLGAFQKTSRENQDKDLSTTLKTLQKVATLEFDRERKSMSVLIREAPDAPNSLVCKGAPEYVLDRCSHFQSSTGEPLVMNPQMRETILQSIQEMGQSAFRGLALAQKNRPASEFKGV
jgi:Ca2+-transporting ATPase